MQLSHLFRRSGRAIWLIVLVPLLAVAGALVLVSDTQPDDQTLATVSVIAPEGSSTAAVITQAVDSFRSTVVSDSVVELAAQDAGVSVNAGRDISAERVGTSNLVELHISTQAGEDGAEVVRALVARANEVLFSSNITSVQARVETAQDRYDRALAERSRESERTGLLLPIETYRAKASEVTQLRVALATAGASGIDRSTLQAALAKSLDELDEIGGSVAAFENLEDSVVRARAELGAANQEVDNVEARLQAATDSESVVISDPTRQSMRTLLVRAVVAALVVGTAVGCGLVLLIGLLRRPQPPGSAGHHSDAPSPAEATDIDEMSDAPGPRNRMAALP